MTTLVAMIKTSARAIPMVRTNHEGQKTSNARIFLRNNGQTKYIFEKTESQF